MFIRNLYEEYTIFNSEPPCAECKLPVEKQVICITTTQTHFIMVPFDLSALNLYLT